MQPKIRFYYTIKLLFACRVNRQLLSHHLLTMEHYIKYIHHRPQKCRNQNVIPWLKLRQERPVYIHTYIVRASPTFLLHQSNQPVPTIIMPHIRAPLTAYLLDVVYFKIYQPPTTRDYSTPRLSIIILQLREGLVKLMMQFMMVVIQIVYKLQVMYEVPSLPVTKTVKWRRVEEYKSTH